MYRLNETILLCTININPWLQKDFHVYNFLHEFQKSNVTNVKLITLKRKKEISLYILNVFNQYISCEYSKVPSQWDGSFEHPRYKTMVVNRAFKIL